MEQSSSENNTVAEQVVTNQATKKAETGVSMDKGYVPNKGPPIKHKGFSAPLTPK